MSAHAGEDRLGPYCLQEQLGEGGMGVVYLASDAAGQPVAVKVLRQGVPAEATARGRLAREVDTMRRVHSPYVAEVVDADVEGSPPYIVTRFVAGRTLEDVVSTDGPLTGQALAALAHGLAAALLAVHSAGVVHRDLKPGNVMLVDGEPVVIDFGIAQAPDATRLTMTGMFMGTPGYLAQEIIEGRASGPAADIHSWGATLAFAASGRPPFGSGQFEAIFYRIVHGQPELADIPAALLPLVLAALARDPARRPSAAELAERAAALDPGQLVPGLPPVPATAAAAHAAAAGLAAGQRARTAVDAPAWPLRDGMRTVTAAPAARPGTVPIPVARPDDFADLLPPVRYDQPGAGAAAAQLMAGNGAVQPAGAPAWPASARALSPAQAISPYAPAGPASPGGQAGSWASPASHAAPARLPLVLATFAALVAVSVLLPVAGALAALTVLIGLRAADLTTGWLERRRARQGVRRGDAAAAVAFYPWAVVRSVVRFVLLAPLALLSAAAVAVLVVLAAGPGPLARPASLAVGAAVACYCVGPGSAPCRRPLSRFYGRVTRSVPAAVLGSIGLVAVAIAAIGAAATLAPGYWPAGHLGNQLQAATIAHPALGGFPRSLSDIGTRLLHWLGRL
jgi:Protein kinase domain